jgi:hypothetical protein
LAACVTGKDGSDVKLDAATIAAGGAARAARSTAHATDLAPIIDDIRSTGASSLREIATGLNERRIPTARGGQWSAVQVQRVTMQRLNRPRQGIERLIRALREEQRAAFARWRSGGDGRESGDPGHRSIALRF